MLAAHGLLIGALLAASLLLSSVPCTAAFAPPIALSSISARHSATSLAERAGRQGGRGSSLLALGMKRDGEEEEASLPLKVTWYAAEALGNIAKTLTGGGTPAEPPAAAPIAPGVALSKEELLQKLQGEYANEYFISGKMDLALYTDDCLFADPFASFRGKERFVNNLQNLPLFISESETRLISLALDATGDSISSRVMVKLQLNLPWKPVIAWPWGVKHVLDAESGRICEHIESWEVSPGDGVAQVFRPGPPGGLRQGKRPPPE